MLTKVINYFSVLFINLLSKRKVYKKNIHICHSYENIVFVKPKYINTGKLGKGSFGLRYNVYERGTCIDCKKKYSYKIATNVTGGRLNSKFGIKYI